MSVDVRLPRLQPGPPLLLGRLGAVERAPVCLEEIQTEGVGVGTSRGSDGYGGRLLSSPFLEGVDRDRVLVADVAADDSGGCPPGPASTRWRDR